MAASDGVPVSFLPQESAHKQMERQWKQANFMGVKGANVASSQTVSTVSTQCDMHRRVNDVIKK